VPPTPAVRTFIFFAFPARQVKSRSAFSDVDRSWRASPFILCCGRKNPNADGQKGRRQHGAGKSNSGRVRHQCSHLFPFVCVAAFAATDQPVSGLFPVWRFDIPDIGLDRTRPTAPHSRDIHLTRGQSLQPPSEALPSRSRIVQNLSHPRMSGGYTRDESARRPRCAGSA
jgi:hypothetical protein